MNCQDARASLLAGETKKKVASHLEGCVECRRAASDIEHVRLDLQSESMWVDPPPGLEDSVVAAITGAEISEPSPDPVEMTDVKSQRFSSRPVAALFGSVAAVLILVVGVFAMASRTPAPDWETTLAGTDVSPTASAVLAGWNTAAGTRLVLEASDLEPAPEGFVYQLWFSKGHQHISAGTFADPSRVELTVGIARNDFPEVWISLDPTTPGSTGTGPAVVHTTDG